MSRLILRLKGYSYGGSSGGVGRRFVYGTDKSGKYALFWVFGLRFVLLDAGLTLEQLNFKLNVLEG